MSIRQSIVVLALTLPALSAFAMDSRRTQNSTPLQSGTTVHQFEDGKIAMEDKYGRAFRMKDGEVMQTSDGKSIIMKGDEVARLSKALQMHGKR